MRTFIIAEIGVNHNGSIKIAKKLITAAKKNGADAVKFQSYISSELVSKSAELAIYQRKGVRKNSMLLMLKKYELSKKNRSCIKMLSVWLPIFLYNQKIISY